MNEDEQNETDGENVYGQKYQGKKVSKCTAATRQQGKEELR